jgi:hypothetical protein
MQSPRSAPRGATITYSQSHDPPTNSSTPTATVVQKLTTGSIDAATNFATQAKTTTRLNAEVQEAASEDERRPHTMTETQEEKIPRIEHALDVGIPSRAARAVVQGVIRIEDADQSTIIASETRKIQDKTKRAKARINQGVNRPV